MFKNIHLDAALVVSCAAIAAIIAFIVFGFVPYSTLESHFLEYALAAAIIGVMTAAGYVILCDRVLFPILDGFFQGVQEALDERELERHNSRTVAGYVKPFRPRRAGLPRRR